MRSITCSALGLALAFIATPALADETDPPKAITVTGGATVVSDYRFRGISQSNKRFAVQGTLSVAHESGVYATLWGSSVDDYIAAGGDAEIDISAGFKKSFGGTTVDVGALYYYYPGAESIVPGYNSDFLELYGSVAHTIGPVTAKASAAFAPKQKALNDGLGAGTKDDNLYGNLSLSAAIPDTGLTVSAAVGRTFTRSFLSGGQKYTDLNFGLSYTTRNLTFGVNYIDASKSLFSYPFGPGINRNINKGGIVGSVGVSF